MTKEQETALTRRLEGLTRRELALRMSRIARFGGAGKRTCSVLWHSLSVPILVYKRNGSFTQLAYALFHDAHEVLCGDVLVPFKSAEQKALERKLSCRLLAHFGLSFPSDIDKRLVDEADKAVGDAETFYCGIKPVYDFALDCEALVAVEQSADETGNITEWLRKTDILMQDLKNMEEAK